MSLIKEIEAWNNLNGSEIMGYCYGALGDSFAMFSHTVLMNEKYSYNMPISINGGGKKILNFKKFKNIVYNGDLVQFTQLPETKFNKLFCTRKHIAPYCKLKKTWNPTISGPICFHYDTLTIQKRSERFPDKKEEEYFLNLMKDIGAINISYPMPLEDVIDVASRCSRFIGIESGISHIMHAVGIPVTIRNWNGKWSKNANKVEMYHPNKKYDLIKTFYEIIGDNK